MSEKKKGKQRKPVEADPTKQEYAVAKFLRFGLPVREGKLHGMEVKCFIGSAAVDKLMDSKWSAAHNKKDPLFTTRASCVSYMVGLLQKGLFHRAERDKKKKDKDKEKTKKKKREAEADKEEAAKPEEELKERKGKKERRGKKEAETNGEDSKELTEKKTEKKEEKKKKERRLKLVMPDEQFFEDGDEVYVWIYDPVNAKNFLIGLMMVLGAIGLCMFPLWPEEVRVGVYYLSLSAAGFVGFILFLAVVRLILFCIIWGLTIGKHHFWFLPNLTEDVGFFDSFRPLYHHEKVTGEEKPKESKKKKKKKAEVVEDKTSALEEKKEKSSEKEDSDEFEVIKKEDVTGQEFDGDGDQLNDTEDAEDNGLDEEDDDDENGESGDEEEDSQKDEEDKKTK